MAQAVLLDGKRTAQKIIARLAAETGRLPKMTLATVLIGDYPPSRIYVGLKLKMAARAGLATRLMELPRNVAQEHAEQTIRSLAEDTAVNGILIQLPLPEHLDAAALTGLIPPHKDVDGLTAENLGRLVNNAPGLVPCTPLGVMELIGEYKLPTAGRTAVVVGRSHLVGVPLALLLGRKGTDCTVTLCHSRTRELAQTCRQADILIAAAGMPQFITGDFIKPGAAVFDVGVTRRDGKICGDVLFEEAVQVAGAITPMPGGTGPMTVACLIKNTVSTAELALQDL